MLFSFILPLFKPRSMLKTIKEKVSSAITAHPKFVTLGIGLVVTFVVGTAIGLVDHDVFAYQSISQHIHQLQSGP